MAFNYNKLRGRIVECYGNQNSFANAMGYSERTMSLKLNGKVAWKQSDIANAIQLLGLNEEDIPAYFFTPEVQSI